MNTTQDYHNFANIYGNAHYGGRMKRIKIKEPTICKLPSCENLTTHNGGYCCAEHCKEHRGK